MTHSPATVGVRPAGTGPERASSWTVYVDLPDEPERMLLVHGYTGAYDRVSRRVATWLRANDTAPVPKPLYGAWTPEPAVDGVVPPLPEATRNLLRDRGYLTTMTFDEERDWFTRVASRIHHVAQLRRPAYVLMPTYQCNLRCPYCFQDALRTDPRNAHRLKTVDRAMLDRVWRGMDAIDRVHGIDPGGHRHITLFGGEPLLRASRPAIDHLMALGGGSTSFSAITNGTELDAYEDLLGPHAIGQLQITLDGPPDQHDQRRIWADGSGSFEAIAANLTLALDRGVRVLLRMNIDRQNVAHLPRLADEIERRWPDAPGLYPYVSPVHDASSPRTTFDSWQLGNAIAELQQKFPAMSRLHTTDDALVRRAHRLFSDRADPLPALKGSFCGAHQTSYVIDPFGDLYACWERTGDPRLRIGAIRPDGSLEVSETVLAQWRGRSVVSNPTCGSCRYATYCGGGCAAYAQEKHGTMHHNFCDGFQKRFRAAVARAWTAHAAGVTPQEGPETCAD